MVNTEYVIVCQAVCFTHLSHLFLPKHSVNVSLLQPDETEMLFIPRKVSSERTWVIRDLSHS